MGRQSNLDERLGIIADHGPMSRLEFQRILGVTNRAASRILDILLKKGLVKYTEIPSKYPQLNKTKIWEVTGER